MAHCCDSRGWPRALPLACNTVHGRCTQPFSSPTRSCGLSPHPLTIYLKCLPHALHSRPLFCLLPLSRGSGAPSPFTLSRHSPPNHRSFSHSPSHPSQPCCLQFSATAASLVTAVPWPLIALPTHTLSPSLPFFSQQHSHHTHIAIHPAFLLCFNPPGPLNATRRALDSKPNTCLSFPLGCALSAVLPASPLF
jgi:hypothetical protein